MKKLKKAFTLTELVIVIAVIAILAAVLIPTYTSLVRKANISSDTQLARQMNAVLQQYDDNDVDSMETVIEILSNNGFGIDKYNPTTEGYRFVWDETTNQIILLNEKFDVVSSIKPYSESTWELWLTVKNSAEVVTNSNINFNYFLANDYTGNFNIQTLSSFYLGKNVLNGNLSIATLASGSATVSGEINGTLTISAPAGTITHEGSVTNVVITAVAPNSYEENGFVSQKLIINSGKVVVTNMGYVNIFENNSATPSINYGIIKNYQLTTGTNANSTQSVITNNGFVENNQTEQSVLLAENYTFDIANTADFITFGNLVNNGANFAGITVKLLNNINIGSVSDWTPIGSGLSGANYKNHFAGVFDGNGKTISDLKMTTAKYQKGFNYNSLVGTTYPDQQRYSFGLFGAVIGGTLKDFFLANVDIDILNITDVTNRYTYIGLVAGYLQATFEEDTDGSAVATVSNLNSTTNNTTTKVKQVANTGVISNITVSGSIVSIGRLAGIVGWMDSGLIEYCTNNATITSKFYDKNSADFVYSDASGIVSWIRSATINTIANTNDSLRICIIDHCINNGDLSNDGQYMGGLVASSGKNIHVTIVNSENNGNLTNRENSRTAITELSVGYAVGQWYDNLGSRIYDFVNNSSTPMTLDENNTKIRGQDSSTVNTSYSEFNTTSNIYKVHLIGEMFPVLAV